jgi:thiamine pyrophosphate-dependent acetolactate synthase large subunit-like protein
MLLGRSFPEVKKPAPQDVLSALPRTAAEKIPEETGIPSRSLNEIADAFAAAKRPLLIVGGISTAHSGGLAATAAAALLQWASGAVPETVDFSAAENYRAVGTLKDMETLSARMGRGEAGVVFLLGPIRLPCRGAGIPGEPEKSDALRSPAISSTRTRPRGK